MRTAVLLSVALSKEVLEQIRSQQRPQNDFQLLAQRLKARLIVPAGAPWGRFGRASRFWHLFRTALIGFSRRSQYDLIISDQDVVGLLLALMFKMTRTKRRHIVICHGKLAQPHLRRLLQLTRAHRQIDRFVCYGPAIAARLVRDGGIPKDKVAVILHPADHRFWQPQQPMEPERLIVSAGMYDRDYPTLIEAVRGLDVRVVIAAFSPWMDSKKNVMRMALPPNVSFTRLSPIELRDLYARALFVAVPLKENPIQVGSLVTYEAMAMGKALLVTGTEGQRALDVVCDEETGVLLPEGDVQAWRDHITDLLDRPERAVAMGRRARIIVEEGLNLYRYVDEMAALARSVGTREGSTVGKPVQRTGSVQR